MSSLWMTALTSGGSVAAAHSFVSAAAWKVLKPLLRRETEVVVKTAVSGLKDEMNTRFDVSDQHKKEMVKTQNEMALELAKQFGGNGGGMREAINRLEVNMARLEGRVDQLTKERPSGP